MSNPYEPGDYRSATGEVQGELATVLERLRTLGATPDELAAFEEHWDDFDDDWTPERRAQLRYASDPELRQMIGSVRVEHFEHTHTEDEEADVVAEQRAAAAAEEAPGHMGGSVKSLLAWVDEDPDLVLARARAVYDLEVDGQQRTTLLSGLAERLPDDEFDE